ncbi:hypothetical protein [Micrococcus endophyticus]|uniref:hypothetical protein n=1 Tax=Micrococcus endophyticus TaxID=455343 RepID=UPI0034CF916F
MSISSFLTGRLSAFLPLPARLALTFGPRALRAYGDWRAMQGRAAATTRGLPGLRRRGRSARARRSGFPWGVGLAGLTLGGLAGAVAGRLLPRPSGRMDRPRTTAGQSGH